MTRAEAKKLTRGARHAWLLLLVFSSGCSALRRPAPIVDRTQDPRIQQEVESRLAAEPALDSGQMRVEVDGGIVVLYGSVPGIEGWQCAVRNAQLVAGVVSVVDFLLIERAPRGGPCLAPIR